MASSAIFERDDSSPSKAGALIAVLVSMASVFGVFLLVMEANGRQIAARFADVQVPHHWAYTNSGADFLILIAATVGCLFALIRARGAAMKAVLFGVALSVFALVEWATSQAYFSVVGTRVEVVSALPWEKPVTFDLRNAQLVKRGCYRSGGKSRRNVIHFVVRDPATGTEANLGAGLNTYLVGDWLQVMQPYLDGSITLTEGEATERNPNCASGMSVSLPEPQRAQLRRLLGVEA